MHDAFYSSIATFCASAIEIVLCYGWANDYIHIRHRNLSDNIILYIVMAIGISHMRKPHFYITHRVMHPWRVSIEKMKLLNDFIWNFWYLNITVTDRQKQFFLHNTCFIRNPHWRRWVFRTLANFCTNIFTASITRATILQHSVEQVCILSRPQCIFLLRCNLLF